jgi:hypothetical protein
LLNQLSPIHKVAVFDQILRQKRIPVRGEDHARLKRNHLIPTAAKLRRVFDPDGMPRTADHGVHRRVAAVEKARFFVEQRDGIGCVSGQEYDPQRQPERKKRLIRLAVQNDGALVRNDCRVAELLFYQRERGGKARGVACSRRRCVFACGNLGHGGFVEHQSGVRPAKKAR